MKFEDKNKISTPPRTAIEVFEMLPEGTMVEVIHNTIYMSPSPIYQHQKTVSKLFNLLFTFIEDNTLGDCIISPIDVYFDDENVFQPDIIFIAKENLKIVKEGKVKGSPDIAIEVLSGNKDFDLVMKKGVYENFGVKEYFVVNHATKEVITFYLEGSKFKEQEKKIGKLKSKLLKKVFSF